MCPKRITIAEMCNGMGEAKKRLLREAEQLIMRNNDVV
jgi:hypothetical protein